jgi:hypothetical protein
VIKLFLVISDDGRQLNTIVTSITPPNTTTAVPANIHSDATKVHNERPSWSGERYRRALRIDYRKSVNATGNQM